MAAKRIINPELKSLYVYWFIFFVLFMVILSVFVVGGAIGGALAGATSYALFELILRTTAKNRGIPAYLTEEEALKASPGKTMKELRKEQGSVLLKPALVIVGICLVILVVVVLFA